MYRYSPINIGNGVWLYKFSFAIGWDYTVFCADFTLDKMYHGIYGLKVNICLNYNYAAFGYRGNLVTNSVFGRYRHQKGTPATW